MGGVPFEDVRTHDAAGLKAAGKLTFGALPILEVDGKVLSQTQAMAVYAARVSGIQPADAWAAAKVDEALDGCTDVTVTISATFILPAEEKVAARRRLIQPDGRLTMHLGGLEKICVQNGNRGHAVGNTLTVADLAIWRLVGWIGSGNIEGIPKDYVASSFPAITKLCATVDGHSKVKEWKQLHPKFYARL